jgi:hypothetical protein
MIRVTDKNVGNPNSLGKRISEPVDGTKNVSNFPHSHCISAFLLLKSDKSERNLVGGGGALIPGL